MCTYAHLPLEHEHVDDLGVDVICAVFPEFPADIFADHGGVFINSVLGHQVGNLLLDMSARKETRAVIFQSNARQRQSPTSLK